MHHVTSKLYKVNLNAPLYGIFYPLFLSVDGICRSAAEFVLFCTVYVLVAQLFLHPHLVPHRQHTVPIKSSFSLASSHVSQFVQRVSIYIVTMVTGVLFTQSLAQIFLARNVVSQCGALSVAVRLFMSSALRRAVNAGRRANCVIGRYAEIQL